MWFLRVATNWLQSILPVLFVLMIFFGLYGYVSNSDYDEAFSVTFTFSCKSVLANQREYPEIVVQDCIKLSRQLAK